MKRSLLCAALAALTLLALPALAAAGNDVAKGNGFFQFSSFSQFSFNAQSNFNGTDATGSATFTNPNADPNQSIKGRVTCLFVAGNVATIAGEVTSVQGNLFTTIRSFYITAEDSGKFGTAPDAVNYFFSVNPPPSDVACTAPFTITPFPIAQGDIVVKDANS
jgi:hypothetical protein